MSENNYGALMMKSAVAAGDDINAIVQPGIYIIPAANNSSPDAAGGVLTVHSGSPIRRTFTSDSIITLTSTRNGNAWTAWKGPLSRTNPGADIKADGVAAIAEFLSNLGLNRIIQIPEETRILSPGGERYLVVKDDGFGLWDKNDGPIPLEVVYGGTGAKDAAGALANFGIGPIATAGEIQEGTAKKLVDAERLIGAIATDADIQNRVGRKLVDAERLINAIATRDEIDSGAVRKLVSGAGLINSIATDADIQNRVARKLVDAVALMNAIATRNEIDSGEVRKLVSAAGLIGSIATDADIQSKVPRKLIDAAGLAPFMAAKAPLASPALTGKPTAPTAPQSVSDTQIATTAFVKSAVAALVASSPEALDTLNELALALGNDPNFATTMTNALAGKQSKDATLTSLSGKDIAGLLSYLGIGPIATDADIQNRVARKLVDAVALMNAIATRDEIDSGEPRKLVSAAGLINSIATDSDIQNKVPRKLVDARGLIEAISTIKDVQDGALRKFVNALTLKNYLPAKRLEASGFIRIPDVPDGTIIQYGQVSKSIGEGVQGIVYPTPFPNATRFAIAIPLNLSGNNGCDLFAQLYGVSTTGCNFYFSWATSSTPADGFQWFAIGY